MSTKVHHFEVNWPKSLLSGAIASATTTFILAGDVSPNLSDIFMGLLIIVGSEIAASYILFSLSTRHKQ